MGRYNFKRTGSRAIRINDMPHPPEEEEEPRSTALLYRRVTGQSVDKLNAATRGVRSKKVVRILDYYKLPMVFEHQVERAREASPIDRPPSAGQIIAELIRPKPDSDDDLPLLRENVSAQVLDVELHHKAAGLLVDYPGRELEQRAMERAVHRLLSLPDDYEVRLGPADAYIDVTIGKPTIAQLDLIRGNMPDEVRLSSAPPDADEPTSPVAR